MSTEFLGSGWGFPVGLTEDGGIGRAAGEDSIRDAIWLILSTAPGERRMRPDFGCGIQDLVFAVADSATSGLLASRVREALTRWEPRIDVLGIEAGPDAVSPTRWVLDVTYRVRTTNTVFNLVYPFYLEEGQPGTGSASRSEEGP